MDNKINKLTNIEMDKMMGKFNCLPDIDRSRINYSMQFCLHNNNCKNCINKLCSHNLRKRECILCKHTKEKRKRKRNTSITIETYSFKSVQIHQSRIKINNDWKGFEFVPICTETTLFIIN
jgi:hypothetical protein